MRKQASSKITAIFSGPLDLLAASTPHRHPLAVFFWNDVPSSSLLFQSLTKVVSGRNCVKFREVKNWLWGYLIKENRPTVWRIKSRFESCWFFYGFQLRCDSKIPKEAETRSLTHLKELIGKQLTEPEIFANKSIRWIKNVTATFFWCYINTRKHHRTQHGDTK